VAFSPSPGPIRPADAARFVAAAAPDREIGRAGEVTWALAEPANPERLIGVISPGEELG
jgi:hypothetical protein